MMVMRIVHLMWYSGGSTLEDCLEGGGMLYNDATVYASEWRQSDHRSGGAY